MLIVSSSATTDASVVAVQAVGAPKLADVGRRDVLDVGLAAVDRVDLAPIEIDAGRVEARAGQLDGQRQADVAQGRRPRHARCAC